METLINLILLILIICGVIKFISWVKDTTKKTAFDTFTKKGRNRSQLVNELYQFVQQHGGLERVYISKKRLEIRDLNNYTVDSYFFEKHGYTELEFYTLNKTHLNMDSLTISNNSGGQIAYDLAKKLRGHVITDGHTVMGRGGSLGDTISFAMGNYGTCNHGDSFVIDGAWILNNERYAVYKAQQKSMEQQRPIRKQL
ncbi:hypothetical protein [Hespellia stercorisuis]|uniref:Uncharacterized protein n=1 Tax=Hespellia stercorisuis DSM 15480 TaxID=1121950 RepID=A0A1M6R691_9FIRM|nr:hypothetical protein [Hespellia stercorisuis]SHK27847.1 hypothetical protein SAMN02745243_02607 [Hespellia stercorisuis DSM 15480]